MLIATIDQIAHRGAIVRTIRQNVGMAAEAISAFPAARACGIGTALVECSNLVAIPIRLAIVIVVRIGTVLVHIALCVRVGGTVQMNLILGKSQVHERERKQCAQHWSFHLADELSRL